MNQNKLLEVAAFLPRSLESPNAWVGHLPFAAWLIQEISPKVFVELGTHSGNSYFTFCQSIVEADLSTKCYAVDTWVGDEHSGQYEDEIFDKVNTHHQEHYAGFSRLLRMTFDEAVNRFSEKSIELLHIDGFHTYEAVRHDFDTWLPKLAPGAVVVFHDTNVFENDFGVSKVWGELEKSYPNNLKFVHSHGLGVLQLNNASENKLLQWLRPNFSEKQQFINYFTALGSRQLERFELNKLKQHASNLNQTLSIRDRQIDNRDRKIANRDRKIANRDRQIANRNLSAAERDGRIAIINLVVTERDRRINNLNLAVAERNRQIDNLNLAVAERDRQIGGPQPSCGRAR